MNALERVGEALTAILDEALPQLDWQTSINGAHMPKKLTGTVSCDRVSLKSADKTGIKAEALYDVMLLCPNPALMKDTPRLLEGLAEAGCRAIWDCPDLDGWATDSEVMEMIFGAPAGRPEIGAALLKVRVAFNFEEDE